MINNIFVYIMTMITMSLSYSNSISIEKAVMDFIDNHHSDLVVYTICLSSDDILTLLNDYAADNDITVIIDSRSLDYSYSVHDELSEDIELYVTRDASLGISLLKDDNAMIMGNFSLSPDKYNKSSYMMQYGHNDITGDVNILLDSLIAHAYLFRETADTVNVDDILSLKDYYDKHYICLKGIVTAVNKSPKSNTYFLEIDNSDFTIVIFSDVYNDMKTHSVTPMYYLNRTILVTGTFLNHPQYGPELILSTPSNLSIYK